MSRVAVAVVAVVVLAWLAAMEVDTRLQARAAPALRPGATAAQVHRGERDLRKATWLNPDAQPRIDRALLLRGQGKTRRSIAAMEAVLRDEPDNVVGWAVLSVLARGTDARAEARAVAAGRRLDPLRAPRGR